MAYLIKDLFKNQFDDDVSKLAEDGVFEDKMKNLHDNIYVTCSCEKGLTLRLPFMVESLGCFATDYFCSLCRQKIASVDDIKNRYYEVSTTAQSSIEQLVRLLVALAGAADDIHRPSFESEEIIVSYVGRELLRMQTDPKPRFWVLQSYDGFDWGDDNRSVFDNASLHCSTHHSRSDDVHLPYIINANSKLLTSDIYCPVCSDLLADAQEIKNDYYKPARITDLIDYLCWHARLAMDCFTTSIAEDNELTARKMGQVLCRLLLQLAESKKEAV